MHKLRISVSGISSVFAIRSAPGKNSPFVPCRDPWQKFRRKRSETTERLEDLATENERPTRATFLHDGAHAVELRSQACGAGQGRGGQRLSKGTPQSGGAQKTVHAVRQGLTGGSSEGRGVSSGTEETGKGLVISRRRRRAFCSSNGGWWESS